MRLRPLLLGFVLILAIAACKSSTAPGEQSVKMDTIAAMGHAYYWTDIVGFNSSTNVTATWLRAVDSSRAILRVTTDSLGLRDTLYIAKRSSFWYQTDQTFVIAPTSYNADVKETHDSIALSFGYGFSGVEYYLRKN